MKVLQGVANGSLLSLRLWGRGRGGRSGRSWVGMLCLTMRLCGRQVCGRSKLHGRHRLGMLNRVGGGSGLHVLEEAEEQRSCWPDGRSGPGIVGLDSL